MSRYTINMEGNTTFNFGFDHALGYFYDKFDEVEEVTLEEKSSMFDKLTGFELSQVLENTFSREKLARFAGCISRMKLDLDF